MNRMDLCPNCFESKNDLKKCPHCGFNFDSIQRDKNALTPMSIVSERYLIGKKLGAGGFGITYKCKDLLTDEICAIKEFFPVDMLTRKNGNPKVCFVDDSKKSYFEQELKNFLQEAKVLFQLREEENIVHVQNFFTSNNTAYIVMEYLDGISLKTLINMHKGHIDYSIGCDLFRDIALVLDKIHSKGVLHRDISPENIFITKDAKVHLIDFGSARNIVISKSNEQYVQLKPGFAPLEQYSVNGNQGEWTDIYALASTFYQAVSGVPVPPALERKKEDKFVSLSEVCPQVNPDLNKLINKALAVDYENRYKSINELMIDYNKCITVNIPVNPIFKTPEIILKNTERKNIWRGESATTIECGREYRIGRSANDCDIVIDSADYVSRVHCVLYYSQNENCFYIKDLSRNGTFYGNGLRFKKNTYQRVEINTVLYFGAMTTAIMVTVR